MRLLMLATLWKYTRQQKSKSGEVVDCALVARMRETLSNKLQYRLNTVRNYEFKKKGGNTMVYQKPEARILGDAASVIQSFKSGAPTDGPDPSAQHNADD